MSGSAKMYQITGTITLAWYKAAWPWMAIYSSLLPCTIILTLPVAHGSFFPVGQLFLI